MEKIRNNLRVFIQFIFFIYTLGIGARFLIYIYSLKAGEAVITRPPGVEAFLPISALLALKQLFITGVYDKIHPAGLTIFLAAIFLSIAFKKGFCSHICPVGFVSETISRFGYRFNIPKYIPVWVLKYVLLALFIYLVFFSMNIAAAQAFLRSPYNIVSDYKMLQLFLPPSITTVIVVSAIILLTLVFRNFWCKYLCPYGALMGLASLLSPVKVKRNKESCINCNKCSTVCPAGIKVHLAKTVHTPECIGCHECIKHRANKECLELTTLKYTAYLPAVIFGLFCLIVMVAIACGLWYSEIPDTMYKKFMSMNISHY